MQTYTIADDDWLVRGIDTRDLEAGNPTSAAFNSERFSANILSLESIEILMAHPARFPLLAAFSVRLCQELDLGIVHQPQESNPEHFEIVLEAFGSSQRKKKARKLQKAAVFVAVQGSAEDVYRALRARCDDYDRSEGPDQ